MSPFSRESKFAYPTAISADAYLSEVDGSVVLLRDAEVATPLRAAAVLAAEATADFAVFAELDEVRSAAEQIRTRLTGATVGRSA